LGEDLQGSPVGVYSKHINRMDLGSEGDLIKQTDGHIKAFFTFGRFQPPTTGHAFLVNKVAEFVEAQKDYGGADGYVFVSSSKSKGSKKSVILTTKKILTETDARELAENMKDTLDVGTKTAILKKMHSDKDIKFINTSICKSQAFEGSVDNDDCTNINKIIRKLFSSGYTDVTMIIGQDRLEGFSKFLPKEIKIVGIGEVRTIKSISGTNMRIAAALGDFLTFEEGVQNGKLSIEDIKSLFNNVRSGMGLLSIVAEGGKRNYTNKKRRKHKRTHKKRK